MEGRGKMLNLPQILGKRVLAERILDILSQSRVDMFICVYFANVPSLETGCFERGFCQGQRMDRGSDSKWFSTRNLKEHCSFFFGFLFRHTRIVGLRSCKPARVPLNCDNIHNRDMF